MAQEMDRELARLWRVSRTVHEMMRDRVSVGKSAFTASLPGKVLSICPFADAHALFRRGMISRNMR